MNENSQELIGLFIGRASRRWEERPRSAIQKQPVLGSVMLRASGLEGDEQADLKLHGGSEKAVHHYPAQHYPRWADELGPHENVFRPGGFGENFSSYGFHEENVCIGDVFRVGTALIQVTQGRTPCWKLNRHTGIVTMAASLVQTGRTGWYCRVLEEGHVGVGNRIERVERYHTRWTVGRVTRARLTVELDPIYARDIASLRGLSSNWATSFGKKSQLGYQDDPAKAWENEPFEEK